MLVLVAALDILFVSNEHAHTTLEHIPLFWSIFGFVGCVLIIILSKWYGHLGIMTREDYYEDSRPEQEDAMNTGQDSGGFAWSSRYPHPYPRRGSWTRYIEHIRQPRQRSSPGRVR